jgi:hypothetical protein
MVFEFRFNGLYKHKALKKHSSLAILRGLWKQNLFPEYLGDLLEIYLFILQNTRAYKNEWTYDDTSRRFDS